MKVLLAEADADIRASLAGTLRDAGFSVVEAGDVADALKVAEETDALHLLVINHDLGPGATGIDLVGKLRERHPVASLVLMSKPPHAAQVLSLGANDCLLTIPFRADNFFQSIRELTRSNPGLPSDASAGDGVIELDATREVQPTFHGREDEYDNPIGLLSIFRGRR